MLATPACHACRGEGNVPTVLPWESMTGDLARAVCPGCAAVGTLDAEWRLEPVPTGVREVNLAYWPWVVCRSCGWSEKARAMNSEG